MSSNLSSKYAVSENIKQYNMVDIYNNLAKEYIKKLVSLNIANGINGESIPNCGKDYRRNSI